jgi:N-acetyl-gamma-glutamyl-phosphate reductase
MKRVGIINVTGYAGAELARLLWRHPEVLLTSVTGRSAAGQPLGEVFPHLAPFDLTVGEELDSVDLAFSALPHGASAPALTPLIEAGLPVLDLSADFRLRDVDDYEAWYGRKHPAPHLLPDAVYGMPELHRESVSRARLVAVPGCYPSGAIPALAPALKAGLIEPDIIIDSKSGVSGAGRTLGLTYHYAEANDSVSAYGLEGHFHLAEITQELSLLSDPPSAGRITFVPHLIPMTRGILTTCYAPLAPGRLSPGNRARSEVRDVYRDFYSQEPFIRVVDAPPQTKHTWGSNCCLLYPTVDVRTGRLVVVSCLDNLVKGAAGQAIQDMNLMLGFPETSGLEDLAVYP